MTLCVETLEIPQSLVRICKFSRAAGAKQHRNQLRFSAAVMSDPKGSYDSTHGSVGGIKYSGVSVTTAAKDSGSESHTHAAGRSARPESVFTDRRRTLGRSRDELR